MNTTICKCGNFKIRLGVKKKRLVCKPCRDTKNKEWRERNKEALRARKLEEHAKDPTKRKCRQLRKAYGITYKQYIAMAEAQNGKCKTCNKTDGHRSLSVDHDHKTGKVRGLLCTCCNRAIGLIKDNSKVAANIAVYLTSYGAA